MFPAPDPPVRGDRGRRSRPARRRAGRTAGLLAGALLAVVAGGYVLTVLGSGEPDAAAVSAESSGAASPAAPAPDGSPEPEPGRQSADEQTDGRQPRGERAIGRGKARVPALVGSTLPQARAAAERAGLRVVPVKRLPGRHCQEGPAEPGTVCAQSPKPGGAGVARGSTIRVRVPEDRPRAHHRPARP
ncbi:PASTA domain-containing protein [Streptomyces sp. NPDC127097]|uniref:PASTA domain-containing protein n=1 Tax=Streptomyces sp. NPDC127097 TaxID=3347136 RepID=UPI00365C8A0A